jgi:hypothetical protein
LYSLSDCHSVCCSTFLFPHRLPHMINSCLGSPYYHMLNYAENFFLFRKDLQMKTRSTKSGKNVEYKGMKFPVGLLFNLTRTKCIHLAVQKFISRLQTVVFSVWAVWRLKWNVAFWRL